MPGFGTDGHFSKKCTGYTAFRILNVMRWYYQARNLAWGLPWPVRKVRRLSIWVRYRNGALWTLTLAEVFKTDKGSCQQNSVRYFTFTSSVSTTRVWPIFLKIKVHQWSTPAVQPFFISFRPYGTEGAENLLKRSSGDCFSKLHHVMGFLVFLLAKSQVEHVLFSPTAETWYISDFMFWAPQLVILGNSDK